MSSSSMYIEANAKHRDATLEWRKSGKENDANILRTLEDDERAPA